MSQELVEANELQSTFRELSVSQHVEQRNRMVEVMNKVMKENVHFGTIPGTNKPSLYKPGAERLLMTFALSAGKEEEWPVQDLSTDTERRYRFMVPIYHRTSGAYIGFGVGECSSAEEKYAWRKAICPEEFDATDDFDRRVKWAKGKGGSVYSTPQVRTNPADIANTVLKMAKKRALIDAVLTTTGASEVFTQDVEDMPREYVDQHDVPKERTQSTTAPATTGPIVPRTSFFKEFGGKPWSAVPDQQLSWYADAINQNIEDPDKSKFKANNEKTLQCIIAELDRRNKLNFEADAKAYEDAQ